MRTSVGSRSSIHCVRSSKGNDSALGDGFGVSVAIDGDRMVAGALFGKVNPPLAPG
ncbi:MAG: hypothetical protein ACRDHN_17470, partial [Thermomicrobiales bacterium]